MMRKFMVVLVCIFSVLVFSSSVIAQNKVVGIWKTIADEGRDKGKAKSYVEIFERNGVFFGKVVKLLLEPQGTLCTKCEGNLKNKPVVGLEIIKNMKKTGNTDTEMGEEYAGGTVMDPDNGKSYKCKIWVKGDILTLRGYIGFLYRTQKWYRTQ
jgi:uncharacterized protein (DUF2147 family)